MHTPLCPRGAAQPRACAAVFCNDGMHTARSYDVRGMQRLSEDEWRTVADSGASVTCRGFVVFCEATGVAPGLLRGPKPLRYFHTAHGAHDMSEDGSRLDFGAFQRALCLIAFDAYRGDIALSPVDKVGAACACVRAPAARRVRAHCSAASALRGQCCVPHPQRACSNVARAPQVAKLLGVLTSRGHVPGTGGGGSAGGRGSPASTRGSRAAALLVDAETGAALTSPRDF